MDLHKSRERQAGRQAGRSSELMGARRHYFKGRAEWERAEWAALLVQPAGNNQPRKNTPALETESAQMSSGRPPRMSERKKPLVVISLSFFFFFFVGRRNSSSPSQPATDTRSHRPHSAGETADVGFK